MTRMGSIAARLARRLNAAGAWEMDGDGGVWAVVRKGGMWWTVSDGGGGWPEAACYPTEEAARAAMEREAGITEKQLAGLDITEDANVPQAVCADCADAYDGTPIYQGEEWGGTECRCVRCGASIPVTLVY